MEPKTSAGGSIARMLRRRWKTAAPMIAMAVLLATSGGGAAKAEQTQRDNDLPASSQQLSDKADPNYQTCPGGQCFSDVPTGNTFAEFANSLYQVEIISGYACGGAGEPCDADSRPYYRPGASVTRGQMTKFVDLAREKPGLNLNAKASEGEYLALSAIRDGSGQGGFDSGAAIAAYNSGIGAGASNPNAGVYTLGLGSANSVGLYASSVNGAGVHATTGSPSGAFGVYVEKGGILVGEAFNSTNTVHVFGNLTVEGTCTGCLGGGVMLNAGRTELRPGDVVAMTGGPAGPVQVAGMPAIAVEAVDDPMSGAVIGVVSSGWRPADPTAERPAKASVGEVVVVDAIKPGEYLLVVTDGMYPAVRVDASTASISAGDLLVSSSTPGVAVKVTDKTEATGAIIGKAMGNLDEGTGRIPVLIMLR